MNKANEINNAEIKINAIEWYVRQYTPSNRQQATLSKQSLGRTPTELHYEGRSIFMKEVNTRNCWSFEMGNQEEINVPIWIFVDFQQRDRQDSQNANNDSFHRLPITSVQCIIGTEYYPDVAIFLNYDDDNYSQGYGQIEEAFVALTKDHFLNSYITDQDFRSTNVDNAGDDDNSVGYNLYIFDVRY